MRKKRGRADGFVMIFSEAINCAKGKCLSVGVDPNLIHGGEGAQVEGCGGIWENCLSNTLLHGEQVPLAWDLVEGEGIIKTIGGKARMTISPEVVISGIDGDWSEMVPNVDIKGRGGWGLHIEWGAGDTISVYSSKDGLWHDLADEGPCCTTFFLEGVKEGKPTVRKESTAHCVYGNLWDPKEGEAAHVVYGKGGGVIRRDFYINGINRRRDIKMPAKILSDETGVIRRNFYNDKNGQLHRSPVEGYAEEWLNQDGTINKKISTHYFEGVLLSDSQAGKLKRLERGGQTDSGAHSRLY